MLPEGVERVFHRSDTAGYQIDLLKYCAEGKSERFGVIKFAIINLPGRVIHHARQLVVRLTRNHPSNAILIAGRSRILQLACGPSGDTGDTGLLQPAFCRGRAVAQPMLRSERPTTGVFEGRLPAAFTQSTMKTQSFAAKLGPRTSK